jgi:uncharacterized membrane protein
MDNPFRVYSAGAYSLIAVVLFILLVILIIPLLFLGIAGAAFSRLGMSWVEAVAILLLMVLGSLVNIPLHTFRAPSGRTPESGPAVFDAFSGEPVPDAGSLTTLSLNIGGAVVPAALCIYLLSGNGQPGAGSPVVPVIACFALVAVLTFFLTTLLPGWGIRAPLFLPALAALALGLLLNGGTGLAAGVTAFAGGTMGTLAGATAFGLLQGIRQGIRQVSIGGSGMFGSVFLCAVLAALAA